MALANREIVRMNLAGIEPTLRAKIKALAETTMRSWDGDPEHFFEFNEAREVLELIAEIEASDA